MKTLLGVLALFALFAVSISPAQAACPNLNVIFSEPLQMPYSVDHDNCMYFWDKGNHDFNYADVLEQAAEYNSESITAIAVGGYWCRWLAAIQESDGYFDHVAYLRCGGRGT